jgi:hypothetical protein
MESADAAAYFGTVLCGAVVRQAVVRQAGFEPATRC